MDSEALCDICNTINFGVAGFYGSDIDYDSIRFDKKLTIDRVLQNSEHCSFCGKIAEFFNDWRIQKFPEEAPDLGDAWAHISSRELASLEVDDQVMLKGRLIYIDVFLSVEKPPPSQGFFRRSLRFRRCSQNPLNVTDICNGGSLWDWERGQEHQAYSARFRPLVADTRLFRKWIENCCAMHDRHCNLNFTGSRPPRLRLIAVEKRCVVDSKDYSSYTALSYVWGTDIEKGHFPVLKKSNVKDFQEEGSLTTTKLPSLPLTIDDAMELTRGLGEKYLWADCFCIIQDDDDDKHEFIPQMDSIYGFASVTIVAASGVDVWAGLPGVNQGPRTRKQMPFRIKGVSLLATLESEGSDQYVEEATNHLRRLSYLGESVWNTRAWTFQEKLFSGRALIFTLEQVYWECQKASWCEEGLWETKKSPTIYRQILGGKELRHPWGKDVDSLQRTYRKLVEIYTARTLSFWNDGLNAFGGILNHFERQYDQRFLWALPASFLSIALAWVCVPSVVRRLCTRRLEDKTNAPCLFPSWSWVGWVGHVFYPEWPGYQNVEAFCLIFYHLDDSGTPIVVQTAAATQTCSQNFIWMDHSRTTVTRQDIPETVFSLSIAPNMLCFWSSAAILLVCVRHGYDPYDDDQPSLSHNGKPVPGIWMHLPTVYRRHQELGEFIVIGRDWSYSWIKNRIALLFISWDNHGIAYRRGLVTMDTSDWDKLDNRVWKMITLG